MKMCANCHKPIGLSQTGAVRKFDWRYRIYRFFHHRDCKREWMHKRKRERDREKAVYSLYHPP